MLGIVTAESGEACRAALKVLMKDEDPEIQSWNARLWKGLVRLKSKC